MTESQQTTDMALSIYTLEQGVVYLVKKPFVDYYNNRFVKGEKLTFVGRNFLPYEGGHTVTFKERRLYLQEDRNSDIIDAFDSYFQVHDTSARIASLSTTPAIENTNNPLKELGNLFASLILSALGAWIVFFSGEQNTVIVIVGWFCMILFGLGAFLSLKSLLIPKQ